MYRKLKLIVVLCAMFSNNNSTRLLSVKKRCHALLHINILKSRISKQLNDLFIVSPKDCYLGIKWERKILQDICLMLQSLSLSILVKTSIEYRAYKSTGIISYNILHTILTFQPQKKIAICYACLPCKNQ